MTYERKCENWLLTFRDWITPISEAPASFVSWTGLFVLSAALRRKVYIPRSILGRWEANPNQYIFFVGNPGRVRKTTTLDGANELLESLSDITPCPDLITKEDLLNQIAKKSKDGTMYILAGEFSEFVAKSGPTMYSFLTNMYDGKKKISASTLSRGLEFRERPCVNMLAATTPVWISKNMSEDVIGGGFASRVVFIYEDEVSKRQLIYEEVIRELGPQLNEWKSQLIEDLQHINTLEGEFNLTSSAKEYIEDWYQKHAETGRKNPKLSGYYERKPAHILKVAMCLHLAYSDTLELNDADLAMAIGILNRIEKKLPKVFESTGKNPYVVDAIAIATYIKEKGRCTRQEIRYQFQANATPSMLTELIDGLIAAGVLLDLPVKDESGNNTGKFLLEINEEIEAILS